MTEFLGSTEVSVGFASDKLTVYLCFDRTSKRLLAVHPQGYYVLKDFMSGVCRFNFKSGYRVGYFLPNMSYRLFSKHVMSLKEAQELHASLTELAGFPLAAFGGPLFGIFGNSVRRK